MRKPKKILLFALVLTGCFLSVFSGQEKGSLSKNTVENLRELNQKYAMEMSDIGLPSDSLKNQLLSADLLKKEPKSDYQGLILSVSDQGKVAHFTLNPKSIIPEEKIKKIAEEYSKIPGVKGAEMDQNIILTQAEDENLMGAEPEAILNENKTLMNEKAVKIAIFDSGLDSSHEMFKNIKINTGWNSIEKNTDTNDDLGHGTHIAGIIAQAKVPLEISPYKIVSQQTGRLSHVVAAMQKAEKEEIDIVNMSFGFKESSDILADLIKNNKANMIFVAAAGNEGVDEPFYPAAYDEVIAVGAINSIGRTLKNSNYGSWVDVAALGHYIKSAVPKNQYDYKSGTSQAAAAFSAYLAEKWNEKSYKEASQVLKVLNEGDKKVLSGNLKGLPMI